MSEAKYRRSMEMLMGTLTSMSNTNMARAAQIADALNDALYILRVELARGSDLKVAKQKAMEKMEKTYRIELKIGFEDPKREMIMRKLMRKAARTLLTQAELIADDRPPRVAVEHDDFFEGGTSDGLQELEDEPS